MDVAVDGDAALFLKERPRLGEPKTSLIVWRLCVHAKDGRFPNELPLPIVRTLHDKTIPGSEVDPQLVGNKMMRVHFGSIGMAR